MVMKGLIDQIKWIDKTLLPIFGIKSLSDYESSIKKDQVTQSILDSLNSHLDEMKKLFPVREFSLHKINNKITTSSQAYNIVKKCLSLGGIPFTEEEVNRKKVLRLIKENNVLTQYINTQQMSEIRTFPVSNTQGFCIESKPTINEYGKIILEDLQQNVKKTVERVLITPLYKWKCKFTNKGTIFTSIDLNIFNFPYNDLCGLYIQLKKINKNTSINELLDEDDDSCELYMTCRLNSSGSIILESRIKNGGNLFPDNMVIPFSVIKFSSLFLEIEFDKLCDVNFSNEILVQLRNVVPIFKKKIQEKLNATTTNVIISLDSKPLSCPLARTLTLKDGTISINGLTAKELNVLTKSTSINFSISGEISGYKYISTDEHNLINDTDIDWLYALTSKVEPDFVGKNATINFNSEYFMFENDWIVLKHWFSKYCDTMYNINLIVPHILKNTDIVVEFHSRDATCFHSQIYPCNVEIVPIAPDQIELGTRVQIKNYTKASQLALIKDPYYSLECVVKISKNLIDMSILDKIMKNTKIIYCEVFWNQKHRNNIRSGKNVPNIIVQ